MSRFDTSGTIKNDNFPKVLVGHGVKNRHRNFFKRLTGFFYVETLL